MNPNLNAHLTKALDLVLDVICIVDADGRFVAVSAASEQVFGYRPEEMIGRQMIEMVHPDDRERTLRAAAGVMHGEPLRNFENRYLRKDGQVVDIMWSARWSEDDRLRLAVAREITLRKRAESVQAALYGISEAAHSTDSLDEFFPQIHWIVGGLFPIRNFFVVLSDDAAGEHGFAYVAGAQGTVAPACRTASGILAREIIDSGTARLLTPENAQAWPAGMRADGHDADWLGVPLLAQQRTIGALLMQNHSSEVRYNEQHKSLLQFVSAQIGASIERKQASARLRYLAQYDVLTGLPNRILFEDRLRVALARAAREGEKLALLYIDLDDFKPVNDCFGHATGDLLLEEVARRIQDCLRASDTVCRVGGDEFVVLLGAIQETGNAGAVAENIRAALDRSIELSCCSLHVSPSIGIALYPEHGLEQEQLTRNADAAMYVAKKKGGNCCLFYADPPANQSVSGPA